MAKVPASHVTAISRTELLLSLGLLGVLVVLIAPLPTFLLDSFLAANLSASILILLITINIRQPLEISVFPSLLLVLTLARLSLNVATTRLILLNADAGKIVSTFGGFVVGGNLVVGLVIFLILVVIQFIVITKGAARVSEVAARFTLDALPGKQMAIDAELGAGNIGEDEAREKRNQLNLETEFYGSMDGAGKFVRGDAIAGLVITAINLIGGVVIGTSNGLDLTTALSTYSTLTIGDGLITQIPGLIIATTAGILVTKATTRESLGSEIGDQITRQTGPIAVGAFILASLALIPGLPKVPFLLIALAMAWVWRVQSKKVDKTPEGESEQAEEPATDRLEQQFQDFLQIDQACVEIGVRLVALVNPSGEKGLATRIADLRAELSRKHGIWVPAVRVRDSIRMKPDSYRVIINGRTVAEGTLDMDSLLAIDPGVTTGTITGEETKDPAFGLPAYWIAKSQKGRATRHGYTVVDPSTVLVTHLGEVLKRNAPELLSREDLAKLLNELKKTAPALVDEIKPEIIRVSDIHQVLRLLLAEQVPITNLISILETVMQYAHQIKDPTQLADLARVGLGREIMERFRDEAGLAHVIVLEPRLEHQLRNSLSEGVLAMPPTALERLTAQLNTAQQTTMSQDQNAVLLVDSGLRRPLRSAIERALPELTVLGYSEIPRDQNIEFKLVVKSAEVFADDDVTTPPTAKLGAA